MNEKLVEQFKLLTHGVYVIAVTNGENHNAFTAAWVMQVSYHPLMIAFSINPEHYSYKLLKSGNVCSVNVLKREQTHIADHFGRQGVVDKMAYCKWSHGETRAPFMNDSLAYFDCEVSHYSEAGDHVIAVCRVIGGHILSAGIPMLYSDTGDMDGSSGIFPQHYDPQP